MSDIFENDIDDQTIDIDALDDSEDIEAQDFDDEDFVYPSPLYRLKLEYSCEGVYASVKDENVELEAGGFVIIPTRCGKVGVV